MEFVATYLSFVLFYLSFILIIYNFCFIFELLRLLCTDEVQVTSYTAESCGGSAQKHSMSSTCSAGGDDGDDGADDDDYYYYSPGEGADTFSATCSSGNGSGSSSDSLSSGAVVGIAIGGFAFLALFAAGVYYLFFMKATRATSVVTPAPAVQMSNGVHAA